MSSFFVELWESIFVPGPTPTILRATNVTFAALQVTLFALLVSTYSYHFAILSVLSAGLWWSINWFAAELAAAKARGDIPSGDGRDQDTGAQASAGAAKVAEPASQGILKHAEGGAADDEDTEVEGEAKRRSKKKGNKGPKAAGSGGVAVQSADVEAVAKTGELKHRVASLSDSTGFMSQSSVSTEDEWEKVSETETDKSK